MYCERRFDQELGRYKQHLTEAASSPDLHTYPMMGVMVHYGVNSTLYPQWYITPLISDLDGWDHL